MRVPREMETQLRPLLTKGPGGNQQEMLPLEMGLTEVGRGGERKKQELLGGKQAKARVWSQNHSAWAVARR